MSVKKHILHFCINIIIRENKKLEVEMKKISYVLLMGCISLSLVGCTTLDGNGEGLKISNENEAGNAEVVEEQSESTDTVADGSYYGSLYSDGKDRIGVEDEWGNLPCIVYNTQIEGNQLIVSGSMSYSATGDFENPETSDDMEHVFTFDDNTDFKWLKGPEDAEHYSAEEYVRGLEIIKDTGLCLIIKVVNGVATEVSVSE